MHEDLTSYDCIVLFFTVYPHNINYQNYKNNITIKWFQLQLILPYLSFTEERKRERKRECKAFYMVISLSVYYYLHYLVLLLYYILVHYHWTEGEVYCVRMYLTCTVRPYL